MTGFLVQGSTRLSMDGEWEVDAGLRIAPLQSGRKFIGLAGAGSGAPVSGVGLHVESHYSGPDALDIDLIPAPDGLDAAKLYGDASITSLVASGSLEAADLTTTGTISTDANVIAGGAVLSGTNGVGFGSLLGGNPPLFGIPVGAPMNANFDSEFLGGQNSAWHRDRANHTGTQGVSTLTGGSAGRVIRDDGTVGAWSTATFPDTVATGSLLYGSATNVWSALASVAAGSYLRSAGTTSAPVWSTLTLPNAATAGDVPYATGANAVGMLGIGAANRVLTSTGSAPQWSESLSLGGTLTVTGNVIAGVIRRGTVDASDNDSLQLTGGGAVSSTRGAYMVLYGNEAAGTNGWVDIVSGQAATPGKVRVFTGPSGTVLALEIDKDRNIVPGSAALATNATNGFVYVQSCAGAPTGTPTTFTGRVPHVVDTTNGRAYWYYGGAWHYAALT